MVTEGFTMQTLLYLFPPLYPHPKDNDVQLFFFSGVYTHNSTYAYTVLLLINCKYHLLTSYYDKYRFISHSTSLLPLTLNTSITIFRSSNGYLVTLSNVFFLDIS